MSIYTPSFISFNILVNTLYPSALFTCYTCLCFVVEVVNKLRLQYEGAPKYLRESITGMKFGLRKRWRCSDAFIVTGDSGIDASGCTDELRHFLCTCTVVFLLEDQSRWLWHHEMTSQWSLMLFWKGTIKGNYTWTLGCQLGFLTLNGWVYWQVTDPLAILVPLMEQSITRMNCVSFIHMHVPRPFGELLVSMTSVVWC